MAKFIITDAYRIKNLKTCIKFQRTDIDYMTLAFKPFKADCFNHVRGILHVFFPPASFF
jgi:hypothetical protein